MFLEQTQSRVQLPDGWRWVRLGEVCEKPQYGYTAPATSRMTGTKYLRITDIQDSHVDWESVPYCEMLDSERGKYLLHRGDILFARTGATTGKSFLIQDSLSAVFASYLIRVRPNVDKLLPQYLYAFLQSDQYWAQVDAEKRGGAQPNMNATLLADVTFPLPPLSEQRRIATRLNEIMAEIARGRVAAQAVLDAANALPNALLGEAFESNNAHNWETKRLGDLYDVQLGKMLSPVSKTGKAYRPYLRNANIQWDRLDLTQVHQMDFDGDEFEKFKLRAGDLIVCEGGEVARCAIWNEEIKDCCFQKALHRVRPLTTYVEPRFLLYFLWFSAKRGAFADLGSRSTIAHLPVIRLIEIKIPNPPLAEQHAIVEHLKSRMEGAGILRNPSQVQLDAVNALPAVYLQRAFKGELI